MPYVTETSRTFPGPDGVATRFAPSPTGRLHLGHALSAITGFEMARRFDGRFLLRIEDIDAVRCRPEFEADIHDVLGWLGLTWETPVLRQSEHIPDYVAAARRLGDLGLLYPCFATRTEIQAAARPGSVDPDGAPIYPGLHRGLSRAEVAARRSAGEPFAMRLDMERAITFAKTQFGEAAFGFWELDASMTPRRVTIDPLRWGDAVIQRKDIATSYHLSVVVDDARQGVTLVTRGIDLRPATDIHRLLQMLLGLPEPVYLHHGLLTDSTGRKLAKSQAAPSLAELRQQGLTPADIRRRIGLGTAGGA